MKPSEVKREYQLQQWGELVREQKASGLSVKQWCADQGIAPNAYYYRLHKVREAACAALEQPQPAQLTELPLAPASSTFPSGMQIQAKLAGGEIVVSNASVEALNHIMRVLMHAE